MEYSPAGGTKAWQEAGLKMIKGEKSNVYSLCGVTVLCLWQLVVIAFPGLSC